MKSIVTIAVMLLSSQAPTRQTDASLGMELHESYKAWFAALDEGDGAAMDALEVDDFILVGADGTIMEKHRPRVSNPLPVPEAPERTWSDGVIRRYGDTAILTGRITLTHGTPKWTTSMGTTAVFVRQADKWRMASVQWTPVPPPNGNQ
ncbi:MAG TPA: nuclear transport factor 2 family protein [Gemmatimonadales bacterium]|jgi:ketosteroid isomerase-like protein|nr:nuclear transport factor 2 family protein [Gemmatimonadales bacterium]